MYFQSKMEENKGYNLEIAFELKLTDPVPDTQVKSETSSFPNDSTLSITIVEFYYMVRTRQLKSSIFLNELPWFFFPGIEPVKYIAQIRLVNLCTTQKAMKRSSVPDKYFICNNNALP